MPAWIAWIPTIIKICVEIYKLITEMKKQGASLKTCEIAVSEARKNGDVTKLQELLDKLRKNKSEC